MTAHEAWLLEVGVAIDNVVLAFLRLAGFTVMVTWLIGILLNWEGRP